jgi:hypothetical protein
MSIQKLLVEGETQKDGLLILQACFHFLMKAGNAIYNCEYFKKGIF